MTTPILNAMTIDVEDYFMVSAFEPFVPKDKWDAYECRVVANTRRVAAMLAEAGTSATFFTLGWVGERFPSLIRALADAGHEIACHGYNHRLVYDMTPEEFRQDLRRSKKILEDAGGKPVTGYRAPSFSITPRTPWALGVLKEEGFRYDASLMPAAHARGGMAGADPLPHRREGLAEFPMSTTTFLGKRLPFSGGGYFRLFPYAFVRRATAKINAAGNPVITYLHPWEFDPDQPRLPAPRGDRFRHYVGLAGTAGKFQAYLRDFRFTTVEKCLAPLLAP